MSWLFIFGNLFGQVTVCTNFNSEMGDWNEQLSNISIDAPSLDGSEFLLIKKI
ncbi:MAG: hypothetical protein L3J23_03315 [Flavobacteriaceae bacterium]|nr:hypothetical protein [Flavobacteriaceae bacterium]